MRLAGGANGVEGPQASGLDLDVVVVLERDHTPEADAS